MEPAPVGLVAVYGSHLAKLVGQTSAGKGVLTERREYALGGALREGGSRCQEARRCGAHLSLQAIRLHGVGIHAYTHVPGL